MDFDMDGYILYFIDVLLANFFYISDEWLNIGVFRPLWEATR